jgi:hypothetical protein
MKRLLNLKTLQLKRETRYIDKMINELPLSLIKQNSDLKKEIIDLKKIINQFKKLKKLKKC